MNQQILGNKIEFVNVGKKYEGRAQYTLEKINLTIEPGEFCVILGPSGCGKSTLLRMIAGLISITKGDLKFNGKRVNELDPSERDIAMVFQSYALYPHMNVYDNMAFGLKNQGVRKDIIDQRVKDAATLLKILPLLFNKPKDLSGGQRQRVAIGRAIVRKPSVFLLDEPLSNLDAKLRGGMRRELINYHRLLSTTTVYVTHDQLEAMTMADKIILINNSEIQQIGTPKTLYDTPANLFVASFLGIPEINQIKGKIVNNVFTALNGWTLKLKNSYPNLASVTIAFRYENLSLAPPNTADFSCRAELIEYLGRDKQILSYFEKTPIEITVAVDKDLVVKPGDVLHFKIDQNYLHVFDDATTLRINPNQLLGK